MIVIAALTGFNQLAMMDATDFVEGRRRGVRHAARRADRDGKGRTEMRRLPLNDGWSVRTKANRWSDLIGDTARVDAGHAAARRDDRHDPLAVGRRGQCLFPRRCVGVPAVARARGRGRGLGHDAGVRGRVPRRVRHGERHRRRPPPLRLLELLRADRPPRARRRQRDPRRGQRARRQPLVQRRGDLPRTCGCCAAARIHFVPDGLDGAHARGRRRWRGRGRHRRGAQPAPRASAVAGAPRRGHRRRRHGRGHRRRARDRCSPATPSSPAGALFVARPAPLGAGRPVPLLLPTSRSRSTTRSSTRRRRVRHPVARARPAPRPPDQR